MKKPKGFFTYFHLASVIDKLSDAQAGRLYKALMRYGDSGELTDFSDDLACDMAYTLMRGEIDVNFERYQEICEKRSQAGKRSAELKKERSEQEINMC
ncbi:MAG: hypothetical protein IJI50_06970 [Ruminococcus sp.]|nr:hypothetical protein [Ruminococcus sp.]